MEKKFHWGHVSKYRTEIMGVAIIWIMLSHHSFKWPDSEIIYYIRRFCDYGNAGVELFLLASGIGLYFSYSKDSSLKRFYVHRYVRILVPYAFIGISFWAWKDYCAGAGEFLPDVIQLTLFTKNNITLWYITASAIFYLFFPLIYYWQNDENAFGTKLSHEMKTMILCLMLAVGFLVLRRITPELYQNSEILLTRSIIFVVGCHLGKSVKEQAEIKDHIILGSFAFCFGLFILREMILIQDYWYRMFYVPFGVSAMISITWILHHLHRSFIKIFAFFGERSIEIYMIHVCAAHVLNYYIPPANFGPSGFGAYAFRITVSIILSIITHPFFTRISKQILLKSDKKTQNIVEKTH